jgi:cytochrome c oxidase subunit I
MSNPMVHAEAQHAAAHHEAAHHEASFLTTYVFSRDHKMIGKQFLAMGLGMLVVGGILALLVRWELAWPETPVPGMHWVPEPMMYDGIIPP